MLPGLPRMMLYLDLIRRGSKTFVTLQVTCPQVVPCGALMWCPDVVGLLGYCKGRAARCGVEVERLDHDSAVLPLFLSVSLRKQLPSSEPEFGKVETCPRRCGAQGTGESLELGISAVFAAS